MSDHESIWQALDAAQKAIEAGHEPEGLKLLRLAQEALGHELAQHDPVTASVLETEAWLRERAAIGERLERELIWVREIRATETAAEQW